MADRIKHIKNRNLIVCETFDDFSKAIENIDFNVEDVVGYITSLSNVYYTFGVESIWGVIGFTWDYNVPMSAEESDKYLNRWKKMEHVLSTGYNLDKEDPDNPGEEIPNDRPEGPMPDEEGYEKSEANMFDIAQRIRAISTTKGYGHFNKTTIPFTHIPALSDGYRITAITGNTLANISLTENILYIDKSDWSNLANISGILTRNMVLYADFDGSNITNATGIITNSGNKKLYLKADLSKLPSGSAIFSVSTTAAAATYPYLIADDYYKDLNILVGEDSSNYIKYTQIGNTSAPMAYGNTYTKPILRWEGTGPFKFEYFFNFKNYNSVYTGYRNGMLKINSANSEYYINNFKNAVNDGETGIYPWFLQGDLGNSHMDLTIDCTNEVSDIRLDYDLSYRQDDVTYSLEPIKYIGNVTSIGTYNPCLKIENDVWPELDQSLIDKLNPSFGQHLFKSLTAVNVKHKCPYIIDTRNLSYIRLMKYLKVTFNSEYENYLSESGNLAVDFYPNLIIDTDKIYDYVDMSAASTPTYIKFPIDTIKVKTIHCYPRSKVYFGSGTNITCTRLEIIKVIAGGAGTQCAIYDSSIPIFHIKKLDENTNIYYECNVEYWCISSNSDVNIVTFDATDEELMAGSINTCIRRTDRVYTISHPLILSNQGAFNHQIHHCTNFRLIYRSSGNNSMGQSSTITYNYSDEELIAFVRSFVYTNNSTEYKWVFKHDLYERMQNLYIEGVSLIDYLVSMGYTPGDDL